MKPIKIMIASAALVLSVSAFAQSDSAAFKAKIEQKNAEALRAFVAHPQVVAKKTVPRKDFYLYYNHINWCIADGHLVAPVEDNAEVYYVQDGNVVSSAEKGGSKWSAPESPSELFEKAGEEAFPAVTYNGKVLYFSSKDLYGMGGYDIYRCEIDPATGEPGVPQNMGYPFNSKADDLLCSETPDGKYIIFASNRDCGASDVTIYVVEYENYTRSAASAQQVAELSKLKVSGSGTYSFAKGAAPQRLNIEFEDVVPEYDYTFRIENEGSIAPDNTLPDGIVYQIQLFVTARKATVKQLRGISPVFEKKQPSGKYLYVAGLFQSYADAQSALTKVKRAGLSSAYIVAYSNGKSISVKNARAKESSIKVVEEQVRIVK